MEQVSGEWGEKADRVRGWVGGEMPTSVCGTSGTQPAGGDTASKRISSKRAVGEGAGGFLSEPQRRGPVLARGRKCLPRGTRPLSQQPAGRRPLSRFPISCPSLPGRLHRGSLRQAPAARPPVAHLGPLPPRLWAPCSRTWTGFIPGARRHPPAQGLALGGRCHLFPA